MGFLVSMLNQFDILSLVYLACSLGPEKNSSFCFGFIKKIFFAFVNVSILLSIRKYTIFMAFVSFQYWICSISKALLLKILIVYKLIDCIFDGLLSGAPKKSPQEIIWMYEYSIFKIKNRRLKYLNWKFK